MKRLIGVVPQRPNHDFSLTAREILIFHAALRQASLEEGSKRADELLENSSSLIAPRKWSADFPGAWPSVYPSHAP